MDKFATQAELAALLDVTPKTLKSWERQGMPVEAKGTRGRASRYSVAAVVRWREDQVRLAAEAAQAELALARERDEVVELEIVAKEVGAALAAVRSRLLQVGVKVAPQCELTPDAASVKELIDDAIYQALDEIGDESFDYAGAAEADDSGRS
jgi:phage terminase Nu1 subunit (DNA packaging protein)